MTTAITTYENKKRLPNGVVMEVVAGVWGGDFVMKTGDSTWARLPRQVEYSEEDIDEILVRGQNNVSPCPSEALIFPAKHYERNLRVLATAAVKLRRDLSLSRDRQRVLEERNENARLALSGAKHE